MMCCCFFFKHKTAYDMRISDWSSDVCSSDLGTLLVYGHLSGDPCEIPSTLLTTKSLNLHGFTLRAAEASEGAARRVARYAELAARAIRHPEPIGGIYGFGELDAALAVAAAGRPGGRVLLSA